MTDGPSEGAVKRRVARGLSDYWHPVLPSWAVRETPVGITRLCRNIVLWRDSDGKVHALEDRCPHRGARLALGWNLGDRLACRYHGVEVDGAGTVVAVPAVDRCRMTEEARVTSYAVAERHGAIFLYFAGRRRAAPPLRLPEELGAPEFSHMLCTAIWRCNYTYAIDNVMDPMHGTYLHAQSHSMAEGARTATMRTRKTQTGFVFEKVDQSEVNFDWSEWGETDCLWMRLSIPYQRKFGPGGPFGIVGFATPIDEHHTMVFFWRIREVQGWQRGVWRFLYRNRLEGLHWTVLEQDRTILENMAPAARDGEFLYQHDVGLSLVRRRMEEIAGAQIAAAAEAD